MFLWELGIIWSTMKFHNYNDEQKPKKLNISQHVEKEFYRHYPVSCFLIRQYIFFLWYHIWCVNIYIFCDSILCNSMEMFHPECLADKGTHLWATELTTSVRICYDLWKLQDSSMTYKNFIICYIFELAHCFCL